MRTPQNTVLAATIISPSLLVIGFTLMAGAPVGSPLDYTGMILSLAGLTIAATFTVRALKAKTRRDAPSVADSYHYTVRRTGVSEWECACLELPGLTSIAPSMGQAVEACHSAARELVSAMTAEGTTPPTPARDGEACA